MFTRQISSIIGRLVGAGMPPAQAQAIGEFGNCSVPLEHRAPLKLTSSAEDAPTTPIARLGINDIPNDYTNTTGTVYSTFTVVNGNSEIGDGNTTVEGGYAGVFDGVVNISDLIVDGKLILGTTVVIDTTNFTTLSAVTNVRYDLTTHRFQKKTRQITVLAAEVESDWTDWDTSYPVAITRVVRDVTYSTTTHLVEQNDTADVYVLEKGSDTTGRDINQAVLCGS